MYVTMTVIETMTVVVTVTVTVIVILNVTVYMIVTMSCVTLISKSKSGIFPSCQASFPTIMNTLTTEDATSRKY